MIQQTVSININHQRYEVSCPPQQEEHIRSLGNALAERVEGQKKKVGQVGNTFLLLLVALSMEDDLRAMPQAAPSGKEASPLLDPAVLKSLDVAVTSLEKSLEMLDKMQS